MDSYSDALNREIMNSIVDRLVLGLRGPFIIRLCDRDEFGNELFFVDVIREYEHLTLLVNAERFDAHQFETLGDAHKYAEILHMSLDILELGKCNNVYCGKKLTPNEIMCSTHPWHYQD